MIERILVAVDGSDHAHKALEAAVELVEGMQKNPQLLIVHVNPSISINEPALGVDLDARIAEEGRRIVEPIHAFLSGRSVPAETLLVAGDPVNEICRVARNQGCGLIVMGAGAKGMLAEIVLGSVSHGVLKHAHCPVLTVK
ncbi:universal stress protein [Paenibacillus xylanexedens]|uniref:universal stress protein n=1 Tax=Paenibacillus xylanexedens TaxID=528191 RepID=UPI0011A842AA|nr:universal stress protein [Paenibacillus xylanexedens]